MAEITTHYFATLFSSSKPNQQDIETMLECVENVIEQHMNESLRVPFIAEEIRTTVFDMHPSKALGPNGFTALFSCYIKSYGLSLVVISL